MNDTIEVAGNTYQVRSMTPMVEFHVARRMGAAMIEALAEGLRQGDMYPLYPEVIAWGNMSDDDAGFIVNTCMGAVMRRDAQRDTWVPAWNAGSAQPMFQDIDRKTMMQIVREVLRIRIGPFLPENDPKASDDEKVAPGPTSRAAKTT